LKATVLIVTYNYGHLIERAIKSIVNQAINEADIEIVIVDDGSLDNTKIIVNQLQLPFPCRYYYQQNTGKAVATQVGITMAKGDIVFLLDADDWYLPGKIAKTLAIFTAFPDVVHVANPAHIKWEDHSSPDKPESIPPTILGKEIDGTSLLNYFYNKRMLFGGGSTFTARRAILQNIPWAAGIDMYTDEWLILQTLLQGNSYFLSEPFSVWQIHHQNFSNRSAKDWELKHRRLLSSSQTILQMLSDDDKTPGWIKSAYHLKHTMRIMEAARLEGEANFLFRWRKLIPILFSGKFSFNQLWQYGTIKGLLH
jgi:glycosyltransferase involved in cell wall biosynthesis